MKVLLAPTEDFIKRDRTQVRTTTSAGSSVGLPLMNANNLAANIYIVVGYEGSETAELTKITNVVGNTVTVNILKFDHKSDEPVTVYRYNTRKFYGSLTAGGVYTELTGDGSPKDIDVNDPQGTILEYTGGDGYQYFKSTYFNTSTSEESNIVDSNAVLANESLRYCSIYAIKNQAGLTANAFITDGMVEVYRKRAESEVDSYLNSLYILPLINSLGVNEIPFMVENCTTLLAAGYMDYKEFGKEGEGVKWLGEARGLLNKLQATSGGIQLLGSDKVQMQTKTLTSGIRSYPDEVDNVNGPSQRFTMDQKF